MKNRDYKTLVAIATASALVVGSLGVVPTQKMIKT